MTSIPYANNNEQWYYQIMGSTFGPVDHGELRHLIRIGDIGRDTFVKPATQEDWYTADRFEELSRSSTEGD